MKTLYFLILFGFSSIANAVCYHNGVAYGTGTVVGQYVCTASGAWQRT
jgi:hypothetical protein